MKITLDTIVSGFKSVTRLISNFNLISTELNDKVLYRDNPSGEPNQMENNLDMNSNRILNLKDAISSKEPATLIQLQGAAIETDIPSQTGHEGEVLFSDGSVISWRPSIKAFLNIAALPTSSKDGYQVSVANFYPFAGALDGGEGKFVWDASGSTALHNGGTIIDPRMVAIVAPGSENWWTPNYTLSSSTGIWRRAYSGAASVKWFGATGDWNGSTGTDNTTAFENALIASKNLFVPIGRYKITRTLIIPFGQSLVGASPYDTDLTKVSQIAFRPASPGDNFCNLEGRDFIDVTGLWIEGPGNTTGTAESCFDLENIGGTPSSEQQITITRNRITGWAKAGVLLSGQWNVRVINNIFQLCGDQTPTATPPIRTGAVVFVESTSLPGWAGSGNVIEDNYMVSCSWGIYGETSWNVSLRNNIIEHCVTPYYRGPVGTMWVDQGSWYEFNDNSPVIKGSMVVIGCRGWGAAQVSISTASQGVFAFETTGLNLYRGSTPTVSLDAQKGFTALLSNEVQFPTTQVQSSDSNTLDDYEEGLWTPIINGSTTGTATYVTQIGSYVKIGNKVHVQGHVEISALGSIAGSVKLQGLPFVAKSGANETQSVLNVGLATGLAITAGSNMGGHSSPGSTQVEITMWDSAAGTSNMTVAEFSANGRFIFSLDYVAA